MIQKRQTVVVGMSGGVDSSVSALLLKEQGFHVIGLFMKNWEEEEENLCPAAQDYADVALVCNHLNIPFYAVNFAKEYWDKVFSHCLEEYAAGYTPNPDILCNKEIKFKIFLEKALKDLDADFLATGHYCRKIGKEGSWGLGRGKDPDKDQSYFLYTMKSQILDRVLFPIGDLHKKEVRKIAEKARLATALKKDSTGICFIGKRDFKSFLTRYIPNKPGNFETQKGVVIGRHDGIAYYTIGQRKGLKIGGKGDAWFVVGKDVERNIVYIEQGENHPSLFKDSLIVREVSWVDAPPQYPLSCTAKIRYRAEDVPCTIMDIGSEKLKVVFDEPQKAITPRQSVVFYQGDICLGGGKIE